VYVIIVSSMTIFVHMMWILERKHTHYSFRLFFFFQAEDGIRDRTVTGVQTCALPISMPKTAKNVPIFQFRFHDGSGTFLESSREIGRASCRERVEITEVGGAFEIKM